MNIPTIEELIASAYKVVGVPLPETLTPAHLHYAAAIRDAVVAACHPQLRPIAEMPEEVPEGCMRKFYQNGGTALSANQYPEDTHYIDIALPSPTYPADFEQAFAESGLDAKDKDAAFRLWKGGAQ